MKLDYRFPVTRPRYEITPSFCEPDSRKKSLFAKNGLFLSFWLMNTLFEMHEYHYIHYTAISMWNNSSKSMTGDTKHFLFWNDCTENNGFFVINRKREVMNNENVASLWSDKNVTGNLESSFISLISYITFAIISCLVLYINFIS